MTEKELCDLVSLQAEDYGFRVFPEYEGWDIVLERKGIIFGLQAKLELNKKVIAQCLSKDNVHFKAIILPEKPKAGFDKDLEIIAYSLKLMVYFLDGENFSFGGLVNNLLEYRLKPYKLLKVPDFDYKLPAGVRAPRTVSEKRIALCKLEQICLAKGFITFRDARDLGIWIPNIYFRYDKNRRIWFIRNNIRPSNLWPHIWENLNGTR